MAALLLPLFAQSVVSTQMFVGTGGCDDDDPMCSVSNHTKLNIISSFNLNADGVLTKTDEHDVGGESPWITVHNGKLYAATGNGVSAMLPDASGSLRIISKVSVPYGGPVHMTFDRTGRTLLTASYGGLVASLSIKADGTFGDVTSVIYHYGHSVNPDRQEGPHPHSIQPYPYAGDSQQWVYVPDLGCDRVYSYILNTQTSKLSNNTPAFYPTSPGAGPRHMVFAKERAYVVMELTGDVVIYQLSESNGKLFAAGTVSMLPSGFKGFNKAAELALYPAPSASGTGSRFLFGTNRGPETNDIVRFDIGSDGMLVKKGRFNSGGRFPRGFAIYKDILVSLGQDSFSIATFRVEHDGNLVFLSNFTNIVTPVTLDFLG